MKTFLLLLCTTVFSLNSETCLSQEKVLIEQDQIANIDQVFKIIKQQTNYSFIYPRKLFRNAPKVHLKKGEILVSNLLQQSFSAQDLNFELSENNTIVIKVKPVFKNPSAIINTREQGIQISGTISDSNGQPLPGANILEKKTTNGVQSDFDGKFSINVSGTNAILVVSYIGFLTQEVSVGNQTKITVKLLENTAMLDEVVVIGYGAQKKINLTGAVGSIDAEFLENRPITNASQALQGSMPGVYVNQNSGQPGSDAASIRIRGIGTLNNSSPLILVDGIEAPIDNIDPNDIASISVLKDAASAAIYGSRASNGVVLITTRRGSYNKETTVSLNTYAGVSQATNLPKMMTNSALFMELKNEADANSGRVSTFTNEEIAFYRANGPNTDWMDEVFKTGNVQQHNLSVTGGSEKTNFLLSLGLFNQDGITPNTSYKRYTTRLNLDSKLSDKLTIGTSLFLSRGDQKAPLSDIVQAGGDLGIVSRTLITNPIYPVYAENGQYAAPDQNFETGYLNGISGNPLADSEYNSFEGIRDQLLASGYIEYELINDLKVKGTLAANYSTFNSEFFASKGDTYDWITGVALFPAVNAERSRSVVTNKSLNLTSWLQATYEKSFGDHNLSALLGYTQESYEFSEFGASRTNFPSNQVQVLNAGDASRATNYENGTDWSLQSYFARLNYNYNGKYLLEGNIRRDGSSRFDNNKWGVFPSVSVGWILSQEDFMKELNGLDLLKFRASWGQLGNQFAQDNNYPYAAQVAVNSNYNFGGSVVSGASQVSFPNSDIKWETTTTTNIGVNLGLFNVIDIEADYFIRNSKDILFPIPIPATAGGLENPIVNTASVENKGWELAINYKKYFGDFSVGLSGNVTHVKSKVTELFKNQDRVISGNYIIQKGSPINSIYGLKAIGIFQSQDEIDNSPIQFGNYAPGDLIYEDINNDMVIDDEDRVIIGKEDPTWLFGGTINFGYKGFDLSALIQGVSDYNSYGSREYYTPFFNGASVSQEWLERRWTPENPNNNFPRIYTATGPNSDRLNSFWVQDRSFLRLKNVQLGYNFPDNLLEKIKLKKLRLYINGQNLLTITDFKEFDPERPEGQSRGGSGYPVLKIITAGLNITF